MFNYRTEFGFHGNLDTMVNTTNGTLAYFLYHWMDLINETWFINTITTVVDTINATLAYLFNTNGWIL